MNIFKGKEVISKFDVAGFRVVVTKKGARDYYFAYAYDMERGKAVLGGLPLEIGTNRRSVEAYARRWAKGTRAAWNAEAERRAERASA